MNVKRDDLSVADLENAERSDESAAGAKFDKFNQNGDRYLSKSEIATMLGF